MAIRAVISLTNVQASTTCTKIAASATHTAAAMADLVLEYVPKNKRFNDVYTLSELTVIAFSKALADSLQTIDGQSKTVGKSPVEEIATSDTQHWEVEKHDVDPVAMLDTHAANFSKAAADQAALVDLPNWTVALAKSSDIAGLADQIDKTVNYSRVFYDAFGLDDYANVNKDFVGNKGNIFGVSDLTAFTYQKPITDVVGHTDQHNIGTTLGKVESLPLMDAAVVYSAKGVEDATAVADLNVWSLSKATTDAISTSDLSSFVLSKPYFDGVATTDTFSREVEYARAPTETLSVSEITSKEVATTKADALYSTDVFARTVNYNRPIDEYAVMTDTLGKDAQLGKHDSVGANDVLARAVEFNRAVSEVIAPADTAVTYFTKPTTDNATLADSITQTRTFNRSFADWFTLDDFSSVDKNLAGTKTNVFGFADIHACEVEKEVADSFGFLESVTVTRRSTAGFNTASFNTALFN